MATLHRMPSRFEFIGSSTNATTVPTLFSSQRPVKISSGENIALDFTVDTAKLPIGNTQSKVILSVSDYETIPACNSTNQSASFDIQVNVSPTEMLVHLGSKALYGYFAMGAIQFLCMCFAFWTLWNRED